MRRAAVLLAILAAALLVALGGGEGTAFAHPLGNFTVNRYARIEVYGDAIRLHYILDEAEIPSFQLKDEIDTDHDGALSEGELAAYALQARDTFARSFALTLNGSALQLVPVEQSAQRLAGQGGLETTRLAFVYQVAVHATGQVAIGFVDHNFEDRAGWKEIVVRPSAGAALTVDPALTVDRSDALRSYPAESLRSAPDVREVRFSWTAGSGEAAPLVAAAEVAESGRGSSGFSALLDHDRSLGLILLSLLAAFGFGALHALGPGHGKTVVAAYLVGSRGTVRHALALGVTVTATHTATVYVLGFLTLSASAFVVPETLYLYFGVASGVMVVGMGLTLFAGRLLSARRRGRLDTHHRGFFGRAHEHGTHPHEGHSHTDESEAHAPGVTWRSLLTLGVAGGVLPCPSAIVVMLAAISLGQVLFGMLLIVAFSLGLAAVLTTVGVALVLGKRLSGRFSTLRAIEQPALARALAVLPVLSALGVTIAGMLITYEAWNQPGL